MGLNENDEEIRRLKKENQFLNRLLETLFPEKISNEDSFTEASSPPRRLEPVNNFPSTSVLLQYPKEIPTTSFPTYETKAPVILNLTKNKLSKFVEFQLPNTKQIALEPSKLETIRIVPAPKNIDEKGFLKSFGSLEEIKETMLTNPTYFTRMQGLANLQNSLN